MRIVDVSKYQSERPDPLNLVDAKNVGIGAVNIALDRGRSQDVLSGWARPYADKARELGLGLSVYRWLDNRQTGAEHARRALERIRELGGPDGMAHAVDCEDNAGLPVLTDYVEAMQQALGRPIAIYSGRWWLKPRGWNVAGLSPYLWAAPSAGYLDDYPGDTSPHWDVDYGGHQFLSLMQHSVAPLPGTGDCSLTAVRDPSVWAALTGIPSTPGADMTYAPASYKDAQAYLRTMTGLPAVSLGLVGDAAHGTSGYHLGWDRVRLGSGLQDYSYRESSRDRATITDGSSAIDVGWFSVTVAGRTVTLLDFNAWLIAQCRAGTADTAWIREVIYTPDRKTVRRWDRLGVRTTGDSSHLTHTHMSGFRDAENTPKRPLFERFFAAMRGTPSTTSTSTPEGDPDMNVEQDRMLRNIAEWVGAQLVARDTVTGIANGPGDQPVSSYPNVVLNKVTAAARDAAELKARPTGAVVMSASDRDAIVAGLVAGLAVDGGFLAAVAKAVADENYRRQQA